MNINAIRTFVLASALATVAAAPSMTHANQDAPKAKAMDMAMMKVVSMPFKGAEANTGTVSFYTENGKPMLMLSPDFKIPKSPAPHWQVVDKDNNVFTLNNLNLVGNKTNRKIMLPGYISSISKVRIWCTFAEVNLGEASFATPVATK